MYCTVIGIRHYSEDLVQGGLEIPCVLRFEGSEFYASKAEILIKSALGSIKNVSEQSDVGAEAVTVKKRKLMDDKPMTVQCHHD